jgi:hypothetical protein
MMSDLHPPGRYECRLLDRDAKVIATIWIDSLNDIVAIKQAAIEARKHQYDTGVVGYELREGTRQIEFFCWW